MIRPSYATYNRNRKTTWLHFEKEEYPKECCVKGGVCFPVTYQSGDGFATEGFALVGCQDVRTQIVHIYEETTWASIDDIIATQADEIADGVPVNSIKYQGLSHWVNNAWTKYFCRKFYFNQADELSKRHRLQLLRSPMVNPKPQIIYSPMSDLREIASVIWLAVKAQKLAIHKDGELAKQLSQFQADTKLEFPAVHALGCCLMAFEKKPWRLPFKKPLQEIFIPS